MRARRLGRAVHGAFRAVSGSWQRRDLIGGPTHNRRAAPIRDLVVQVVRAEFPRGRGREHYKACF